jgi:hypothetical protein
MSKTTFQSLDVLARTLAIFNADWYVAGGFAAFLHIEAYANKDDAYYAGVRDTIFPGDLEGGIAAAGLARLRNSWGDTELSLRYEGRELSLDLQPLEPSQMPDPGLLCTVGALEVFTVDGLITAYMRAGNPAKLAKRQLRLGMLRAIKAGRRIDATVAVGGPSLLQQIGSLKLKKID